MSSPFRVALTFDAEHPDRQHRPGVAAGLLDVLADRRVASTWFLQGRWVEAEPVLARRVATDGHLVGNHSFYHARMPLLTDDGLTTDVRAAEAAIREATDVDPRPWFRCPFFAGSEDPRVLEALEALGYRDIPADVILDDWEPDRTGPAMAADALALTPAQGDGAVVLLHAWPTGTLDALPAIIDGLRGLGATFVRVDELERFARVSDLLLAVDGGNSKTDVALLGPDGSVLVALRGPTVSHQAVGVERGAARLRALASAAADVASVIEPPDLAVLCLAGMDSPADAAVLEAAHGGGALAREVRLHNDTEAALRAGSPEGWGVAVILGQGINALGVARGGEHVRFAALGTISGDVGGGRWVGELALGAAIRAYEDRGPRTMLETLVAARFGMDRAIDVTMAIYAGRIAEGRIGELAPDVVTAAAAGDAVAMRILETLADEAASWAGAAIRRVGMTGLAVPVILAGGFARGADPLLTGLIAERVRVVAPAAEVSVLHAPPVLGAALLALDAVAPGDRAAADRARAGLSSADLPATPDIA